MITNGHLVLCSTLRLLLIAALWTWYQKIYIKCWATLTQGLTLAFYFTALHPVLLLLMSLKLAFIVFHLGTPLALKLRIEQKHLLLSHSGKIHRILLQMSGKNTWSNDMNLTAFPTEHSSKQSLLGSLHPLPSNFTFYSYHCGTSLGSPQLITELRHLLNSNNSRSVCVYCQHYNLKTVKLFWSEVWLKTRSYFSDFHYFWNQCQLQKTVFTFPFDYKEKSRSVHTYLHTEKNFVFHSTYLLSLLWCPC